MDKLYAYCGINCSECPTFIATQNDDDQKRSKVASQWSKWFQLKLTVKDINCDGCKETGKRLFGHCQQCPIRKCAQKNKIDSCAYCSDYPCDKLNELISILPTNDAENNQ